MKLATATVEGGGGGEPDLRGQLRAPSKQRSLRKGHALGWLMYGVRAGSLRAWNACFCSGEDRIKRSAVSFPCAQAGRVSRTKEVKAEASAGEPSETQRTSDANASVRRRVAMSSGDEPAQKPLGLDEADGMRQGC